MSPEVTFSETLLLSFGVAMDATAVSAARGVSVRELRVRHAVAVAAWFGGFQALMPLLGYVIGARASAAIAAWDHWVAFVLLSLIGGKMVWESRASHQEREAKESLRDPFGPRTMMLLAVATSIDALVVGVTLPMLGAPLASTVTTIGVVTGALSAVGLYLGRRVGAAFGSRLEVLGGLILIGLGIRAVLLHTSP